MNGSIVEAIDDYIALRRGLGYRSVTQERALRAFARHLNGHQGPIPLELTLNWASTTSSTDPRNPARRLAMVRSFLRHLHGLDGATDVPAPGVLGPTGHRTPPHVYSDAEIADLLAAAGELNPAGGCGRSATSPCSGSSPAPAYGLAKRSPCHARTSTSTAA